MYTHIILQTVRPIWNIQFFLNFLLSDLHNRINSSERKKYENICVPYGPDDLNEYMMVYNQFRLCTLTLSS